MMSGIDSFIATGFRHALESELGAEEIQKIEQRLLEKYKITLQDALENNFSYFDLVFREFYGKAADAMEERFLNDTFEIRQKRHPVPYTEFKTKDSSIVRMISETIYDKVMDKVLRGLQKNANTSLDLGVQIGVSQATTYRKMERLSQAGLITIRDYGKTSDGKKVPLYGLTFDSMQININGGSTTVTLVAKKETTNNSKILSIVQIRNPADKDYDDDNDNADK